MRKSTIEIFSLTFVMEIFILTRTLDDDEIEEEYCVINSLEYVEVKRYLHREK